MKQFFLFLLTGIITFFIAGCCKVYCPDKSLSLRLIHFTAAEADTVLFTGYTANGLFNNKTDSFYYYSQQPPGRDTLYLFPVNENFDVSKHWKIKLEGAGREFTLTDIRTATQKCSCGFRNFGKYGTISGYSVNGVAKTGEYVELMK